MADVLTAVDVPLERAKAVLRAHDEPLPWYVRVLTGALGWAASGSFLAAVRWTTSHEVRFGVGIAALITALVLRRRFTRGFFGHLALALTLFGEALTLEAFHSFGLGRVPELTFAIGVEVLLFCLYRDPLVQFMSVFAAWVFGFQLFEHVEPLMTMDGPLIAVMLISLAAFYRRSSPFAYASAFATFALMLGTLQNWNPLVLSPYVRWLVAAVLAVELVVLLRRWEAVAFAAALGAVTLGSPGVLLAVAFLAIAFHRRDTRLLGASVVFLLIFASDFYYQLNLSLLEKSGVLAATGLLFLFAWKLVAPSEKKTEPTALERFMLPMSVATALLLVNVLIVQKERVLAGGETVLLELRPADPRSLMEGDYMALRYRVADRDSPRRNGRLVVRLDDRRVASFVRFDDKTPLRPGEKLLRYREREGRLRLGAEAFYFQEGHADRFQRAAYGELKVTPGGDSVLVGLRDKNLDPLGAPEPIRFRH
jgi:uncharacterized membrane-anchored protein